MQTTSAELIDRLTTFKSGGQSRDEAIALFDEARELHPVSYSRELGGFFLLLKYDDIRAVHRDPETFSNEPAATRPLTGRPSFPPLEYDPPAHRPWREVIKLGFNTGTPGLIEQALRKDVARMLEALAERGSCDLISDFADRVPVQSACHVLGIEPEKGPTFQRLTTEFVTVSGDVEKAGPAMMALAAFGLEEVAARREVPRDDYLTALAQAEMDGRPIRDEEIALTMASALSGGHDTTVAALGGVLLDALTRPGLKQRLIDDPELIPAAVNESLRLHPPFMGLYRRALRDTEIRGVKIPEGESVFLCWLAANRDPEVFEDPHEFRLDRPRTSRQPLTFGYGIHACPGQPTAKLGLVVSLEELLRRFPDVELVDPEAAQFQHNGTEHFSVSSLPVQLGPPQDSKETKE